MSILSSVSNSDTHSAVDWENYRKKNFPVVNRWTYYDHAAVSPLSEPARQAIANWLAEATEEGDPVWPDWAKRIESIRATAANLVNALPTEIAFVPSTSFGISLVAEGLDWQAGDNVVIPAGEFPSNLYPWMHLETRGVELRIVPTDDFGRFSAKQIDQVCDERTKLVSASWVGYGTGFRIDPAEIAKVAHQHGALFFLDAIQGLGVFPLDVRLSEVDFFAADGHKWLMGPEGAGLFFCQQHLLDSLQPRVIGWNSVQSSHDFSRIDLTLKNNAARFEAGTQNSAGILGLGGSLDLIHEVGVSYQRSPIADRVLELTDYLDLAMQKIGWSCRSPRTGNERSGVIAFDHPSIEPARARSHLLENGIVTSVRKNRIRFSPHAYLNHADIDKTVEVLATLGPSDN